MINGTERTFKQAVINIENAKKHIESRQKTIPCAALWLDLLNFQNHLEQDNQDFNNEQFAFGMKRVAAFHEAALLSMNKKFEIVQLNDSIVMSVDISKEIKEELEEFLARVDYLFEVAVLCDNQVGGYGVRGVIATGFRYNLRGNLGWWRPPKSEKDWNTPSFFCPKPIMMNTAFGRAYAVESSKELIKASSLYVEKSLILDFGASIMETWDVQQSINIKEFGSFFLVRQQKTNKELLSYVSDEAKEFEQAHKIESD